MLGLVAFAKVAVPLTTDHSPVPGAVIALPASVADIGVEVKQND